ncbi:MAG: glycosyltransferase [Eubacterium sp.]|nr:glycosyltransferase [Eubacterium sp.]
MPEITVIMPVYQMAADPALRAAVRSIKQQSCQDWEMLLYDDGSSDGTLHELKKLADEDPNISVIRGKKNRGAGYARNRCIRASKGRYVALMDADDLSHPGRLKLQADFLDRHPEYAFVGSSAWMIDNRGVWGLRKVEQRPCREAFLNTMPFIHPSMMFRKEVLEKLHGYADNKKNQRAEDYELLMRLYAAGYLGYNIQKPLLAYREDPAAYKKRKYRYRIRECGVRLEGFRKLGILRGHLRYVVKPLAVGIIPAYCMRKVRMQRFQVRHNTDVPEWLSKVGRD